MSCLGVKTKWRDSKRGTLKPTRPSTFGGEPIKMNRAVGRNDPCPCGSGRKYKRCCRQYR